METCLQFAKRREKKRVIDGLRPRPNRELNARPLQKSWKGMTNR